MSTRKRPHLALNRRRSGSACLASAGALALLAGLIGGCGRAPTGPSGQAQAAGGGAFPVAVTAINGTVRVAKRPVAIVSLSPTATEMLFAIGAGRQVKAVDSLSDYPRGAPRTALSAYNPNVEAIVAEKPDLVVVSNYGGMLTRRLAAFSIPVLALPAPSGLGGVYAQFDQLGQATGHEQQAHAQVARLRAAIARIAAAVPHRAGPLTYYYELDQTYYSVTSSTFIGKLLDLLGLKSIADAAKGAAAAGGYPQLSAEYIVKANPDFIILADTLCCHQSAATVAARPGWARLAAVKEHHIIALNDDIASRWGPRLITLLRIVATATRRTR
jgi:iron complex transport system substrate-binding protein